MSKVVYAPNPSSHKGNGINVFLAGSIDMGKAEDWQPVVANILEQLQEVGEIYNPRRLDFQPDAVQSIDNAYFTQQVLWELDHLEKADVVFMYLDPASKAPISLLELGLLARSDKLIVCCPKGFWRKGNVDVLCNRMGICVLDKMDTAIKALCHIIHCKYLGIY